MRKLNIVEIMNHSGKSKGTMTFNNEITNSELTESIKISEYFIEAFRENTDMEASLANLLEKICRLLLLPKAEIWMINKDDSFVKAASFCENSVKGQWDDLKINNILKDVYLSKEIKFVDLKRKNANSHSAYREGNPLITAIPLSIDENNSAVLTIYFKKEYTTEEQFIDLLKRIAGQIETLIKVKLIEEDHLKDKMLLKQTQKIARIASWELNLKSNNFFLSEEFNDLFGTRIPKGNELHGLFTFFDPPHKQKVEKFIKNAVKSKKPLIVECKALNESGELLDVLIKAESIKNDSGSVEKLIGTIQDITSQKETENALRRSEEYFRSLIENSLDMKSIISPEGKIKYMSPSTEKILGYSPEELIGEHASKYIHPNDLQHIKSVFNDIVRMPGFSTSVEFRVRHKKGRWCIIQSLIKNLLNNPVVSGIIASSRDITSKKEAENSVKSLLAISEKLNSTLDVDIIMDILISEAINLVGAEGGCTGLKTTEGLTCKKYFQKDIAESFEYCWPPGVGLPGWLILNKVPYITNDAAKDPVLLKELVDRFHINSIACIPILDMKNEVIGFLEVKNKLNHSEFTEADKEKLVSLAQIAYITIQNALAYQKIQMAEFQIKNSREQLRRLSAHLQSAREEERTRIAREIHDELGQALTGLKMDISWLSKKMQNLGIDNPQLHEKAVGMSALVDSTIKTVRKISSELRPGVLDYLGLPAAIEWQAQDFQNRTGIQCNIISLPKDLLLDQNKSTAIFRIFQETLTNVARHAHATTIDIELLRDNDKLILKIKDNGRGITDVEMLNTSSFGILGMRERTLLLDGEFSIRGEIDKGTTVIVKIPITESNDIGGSL